jgi:hypothetical protein
MSADPNEGRNDPVEAEAWRLGEDVQEAIIRAGYRHPQVEGIAVDVHDLLQASERIRSELAPRVAAGDLSALEELRFEFHHIGWHAAQAVAYLDAARAALHEGI